MPLDGSGNWVPAGSSVNPAVTSTTISSTDFNSLIADLKTALSTAMFKDGQATPTADIGFAGYKVKNIGAATVSTDAPQAKQLQTDGICWAVAGGTADAITATYSPSNASLVDGLCLRFRASAANATTTPTFAPDGLTARTIVKKGGTALAAGDIPGQYAECIVKYNLANTRWELLNPASASTSGIGSPQGRITLTTAVPVTTSDVTGATTVYYTPFCGNQVPIYNGASFTMTTFAELSQATTDNTKSPAAVAASKVYDLFVWSDSGTIRCTRGPAWTNDTTPGTGAGTSELQMINGIMTNKVAITNGPGANLGTYVGTIRSDGSSQINDSFALRYVANAYNQVDRGMSVVDTTDSWTYTSTTWRQARATAANQLAYVSPQLPFVNLAEAFVQVISRSSTTNDYSGVGVGVDSTSVNSAQTFGGGRPTAVGSLATGKYCGYPGIGAHTLVWLEACEASVTTTWYGDNGVTYVQAGITGRVKG